MLFDDCDARDPVRKVKAVPAAMALRLGSQGERVRLRASATSCKSARADELRFSSVRKTRTEVLESE